MARDPRDMQEPRTHSSPIVSGSARRFGRGGTLRGLSPRTKIGSVAALVLGVAVTGVLFYLDPRSAHMIAWKEEQRLEQRRQETKRMLEETERTVERVRRQAEAAREQSRRESEAFWKEIDRQMQPPALPEQPVRAEEPAGDRQVAARTPEGRQAGEHEPGPRGHDDSVVWLAVSADGRQLVSASIDRSIKLWDLGSGLPLRDVGRHDDMARAALFLPGGTRVLSAGDDGMIATWSLADGRMEQAFEAREHGSVRSLAVSDDGQSAASGHQSGTVIVWDLGQGTRRHVLTGHMWPVNGIAVSADGRWLLTGDIDGEIMTWDVETGALARRWKGHERGVYGAGWLADGKQAVTASGDGLLKLWDTQTGTELRRYSGHAATVYALALSVDGGLILSGGLDGTARLWELATGVEKARFDSPDGRVYAVAFAADGSFVTAGDSGAIRVWAADARGVSRRLARSAR